MSNNSFSILYSGGQSTDALTLCDYIDEFYHSAGVDHCDLDIGKIASVVQISYAEFPSPLGVDKASPFKKVAAFTANFAAEKPIYTSLPVEKFGRLATHQNAILAVSLSIDALEGATIKDARRGDIVLKNRIAISKHYWRDLIAAASSCVPVHHFECLALIYEALAYQANPDASYERVI
jgi:hypothetical protein